MIVAALLMVLACGDDSIVLTIDGRDTVRAVDTLAVEVEDEAGAREEATFELSDGVLGKTLTIATTGRDGSITIRVRGTAGDDDLLIALGEQTVPVGGTFQSAMVLDPAEFGLNDRVVGIQALEDDESRGGAQLAVTANRTALAVWESDHVMGRLFDRVAMPATNAIELTSLEFPLAADPNNDQNASVTNSTERWAVAWEGRSESGRRQIKARTFELADAEPIGFRDATVATSETENQREPDVFALTDGRFGVAWTRETVGGTFPTEVFAQLLDDEGEPVGSAIAVSAADSQREEFADGLGLATGGFVVVWNDGFDAIRARVFDSQGTPVGGDVELSAAADFDLNRAPRATALPDAGFAAAYLHQGDDGAYIALGLYNDSGGMVVAPQEVTDFPSFGGLDVAARGADGTIAVVWSDGNTDADRDVYMRLYDAAGAPCTDSFVINTETRGNQRGPTVEPFGADAFAVAWTDDSGHLHDPDRSGAVARIVYAQCD